MKEIEIEIEVKEVKPVEEKLIKIGAKLEKEFSMRDVYFGREDFYKNFRRRLRGLSNDRYVFTLKSPEISKGVQFADEKENEGTGFKEEYEKLSQKYGKPVVDEELHVKKFVFGSSVIELREIKNLFNYIEISGDSVEEIEKLKNELDIEGEILNQGALNKVLELRGLPKIVIK